MRMCFWNSWCVLGIRCWIAVRIYPYTCRRGIELLEALCCRLCFDTIASYVRRLYLEASAAQNVLIVPLPSFVRSIASRESLQSTFAKKDGRRRLILSADRILVAAIAACSAALGGEVWRKAESGEPHYRCLYRVSGRCGEISQGISRWPKQWQACASPQE